MRRLCLTCIALAALSAATLPATAGAKVTVTFANGILTAQGGKKPDRVRVTCGADGIAKVNGRDPRSGPVSCSIVSEVDAVTGGGNDRVIFSGVDGRFGQRNLPGFGTGTGAAAVLGPGNDRYAGSSSAFNLVFGGSGNDSAKGGGVRDSMSGGAGDDALTGLGGRDQLLGLAGADRLTAGPDDDLIAGHAGNDRMSGGAGVDLLSGGMGMDRMRGGPGDDRMVGGGGKDRMNGGAGKNDVSQDGPKG
jgi:Ca2+-binding RTX toxin-like protein